MNKESYTKLLLKHIEEAKNSVDKDLIDKHIFELAIFPKKNHFKMGEKVKLYWGNYRPYPTGYIKKFNPNGTLFIQMDGGDIGADYRYSMIEKVNI